MQYNVQYENHRQGLQAILYCCGPNCKSIWTKYVNLTNQSG